MQAQAIQKSIRMSPRKLRLVADAARKLTPSEAIEMLPYLRKRAAVPLHKTIVSAVANAKQKGVNPDQLVFKEIQIGEGPTLKRGRPVSKGAWHPVMKRTSRIRIIVTDESKSKKSLNDQKNKQPEQKVKTKKVSKKTKSGNKKENK